MRIFVTGASGFIGRAFTREARERGHELLGLVRSADVIHGPELDTAIGTLDRLPWRDIERFRPEAALHLAWIATPGAYLHAPENVQLVEQSKRMIEGLIGRGVSFVAAAGTCIEYAPSSEPLDELTSPREPEFAYSRAKCALHDWLAARPWTPGSGWSWLRIFYPYGPREDPGRLTTAFATRLVARETLALRTADSVKDFIYIDDLATALCDVIESRLEGPVNVATGEGVSIRRIAELLAAQLDSPASLIHASAEPAVDPRPFLVAKTDRLRSTGWRPATSLEAGLERLIATLVRG